MATKRTRYEVLRRDDYTCRYCGGRAPHVILTVDHVIPTALGGTDDPANLVAACRDCNAGKTSSSPDDATVAQVADDAIRWAAAMRKAADDWLAARDEAREYADTVLMQWEDESRLFRFGRALMADDWDTAVERWRTLGVPIDLITDAVSIAMRRRSVALRDVWRYTCGIVWAKLTELQESARDSVGGEVAAASKSQVSHSEECGYTQLCACFDRGVEIVNRLNAKHAHGRYSRLVFAALTDVTDAEAKRERGLLA